MNQASEQTCDSLPGHVPGVSVAQARTVRRTTVLDIMMRLLQPKNMMVNLGRERAGRYISILNVIQGDADPTQVCPG